MINEVNCRSCGSNRIEEVIHLGQQPLANKLLKPEDIEKHEPCFPLGVAVCGSCWLMQITHVVPAVTLFGEYVYFSSFSNQMLSHAREASLRYISEKQLNSESFVVEIASNDGYLLKNFNAAGIRNLGIEPAQNIAEVARQNGIDTRCQFFGTAVAQNVKNDYGVADLILGNNVFAHASEINDFIGGIRTLLKADGWAILEFPYGVDMIQNVEFDTIYHEHVFYFTINPLLKAFSRHEMEVFRVERIPIHGGSLRIFIGHHGMQTVEGSVSQLSAYESMLGVDSGVYYEQFSDKASHVKKTLVRFLTEQQKAGKRVAAYGASAKGSTLLNYVGEKAGGIEFISDRSPYKQGKLSPGLHIPIVAADELVKRAPDYAILLTWNFADEIIGQQKAYRDGGGRFVIPLPDLHLL